MICHCRELVHFGQTTFNYCLNVVYPQNTEISKCTLDLNSQVLRQCNDEFRRWLRLVVSSARRTLEDGTSPVFVSFRDFMHRHHEFHKQRGRQRIARNGWFRHHGLKESPLRAHVNRNLYLVV